MCGLCPVRSQPVGVSSVAGDQTTDWGLGRPPDLRPRTPAEDAMGLYAEAGAAKSHA